MKRPLIAALMLLALACHFPGFPGSEFQPQATATPTFGEGFPEDPTPQPVEPSPTPPTTATPDNEGADLVPTPTVTPTNTPTLTPSPEAIEPGPPLTFQDPAWELLMWSRIPDTNDWQGTIRLYVNGGTPPYRSQLEDQPIVQDLDVPARWRLCSAMPATVRVWSADEQMAQTTIWVPGVGCPENN